MTRRVVGVYDVAIEIHIKGLAANRGKINGDALHQALIKAAKEHLQEDTHIWIDHKVVRTKPEAVYKIYGNLKDLP